ncbi:Ribosomal large subunit pseudouridine synthase D [Minicystis rosea]|nr:Ribosomal large subunit pseudouridine synthase D [Minicystis rosea]
MIPEALHGRPLDGVVRALLDDVPWSEARKLIETGKIRIAGEVITDTTRKVRAGGTLTLHMRARRPRAARAHDLGANLIVYMDPAVVVVRKPAGISTIPFGDEEPDELTLDALVRDVVAKRDSIRGRAPLGVVQRLDKVTSGLLVFSRTFAAKKHLGNQLRFHTMRRRYLAIAHGDVAPATIRTHLVEDRGDGLRGSVPDNLRAGQVAVTHVERVERLAGATLIGCRLETGRTHQIRIHLSERGHPLLGETVYVRNFRGTLIPAPRLMLHAAELGFEHPVDGRPMLFEDAPPADFQETLARLRR